MNSSNSSNSSAFRIHTNIASTLASVKLGEVAVVKKWKETIGQSRKERGVVIPMECVKAPEVVESFRPLVEAVLMRSAQDVLTRFVENDGEGVFEVSAELFDRVSLTESFLSSGNGWLSKQELEVGFTASATWKRIVSRPEFIGNKVYQTQANMFKETILKLTGKAVQIAPERCEAILAKLEDSDLSTEFGMFVAKRLNSLMQTKIEAGGVDML